MRTHAVDDGVGGFDLFEHGLVHSRENFADFIGRGICAVATSVVNAFDSRIERLRGGDSFVDIPDR